MREKPQWGKWDLCWQRREAAWGDVALFRAQMPVDKTLPVHISWSPGGLTVCSQGFVPVPVPKLAHTAWLGLGFERPASAPHWSPVDAGTSRAVWLLCGVFLDDSFGSGCLKSSTSCLKSQSPFFFFCS